MFKISKNTFVSVIKLIQKQEAQHNEIEKALNLVMDGNSVFMGSECYRKALMMILKEAMGDEHNYIEWWLYELYEPEEKKIFLNDGTVILLDTPGRLYDFLIDNFESDTCCDKREGNV